LNWLSEVGLSYDDVLKKPNQAQIETLREHLLNDAFSLYETVKDAIEHLPIEARGPIRVAVESYMEIGRVLRQDGFVVKAGRATVPKSRRVMVAWRTLNQ
jgi:15-cis-phytoene synthase/lycopene beta-cyclase